MPACAGAAGVALADFSSVVGAGTTFYGTWEATGSTAGSGNPNSQFLQGAGVFSVGGSSGVIPTNAATSGLRFDFATPVDLGVNSQLALTAALLPGNTAGAFTVTLLANGSQGAVAVFSTAAFADGSATGPYSTVTATLSASPGFNPSRVDAVVISGAQPGGTAAFGISFDHLAAVPEPALAPLLLGAAALAWARRRRPRGFTQA